MNASGDTVWTKMYGGSEAFCIQETSDHGLIIAGYGEWPQDFYVVRTDADGNVLWERTYGGSDHDYAKSVKQTLDGGFIIVGSTASFGAGFTDVYIVRTDAWGDTLWTVTYGGSGDERAYSVDLTSDGGYIVGGHTTTFGSGDYDVWLIRFESESAPITLTLTPHNPPIQIPSGGGSFTFNALVENPTSASVDFDAWTEVILPTGVPYPLLVRTGLSLPGGASIMRTLTQTVPGTAPPGMYEYVAHAGTYPSTVIASDSFPFEKLPGGDGFSNVSGWMTSGWEEETIEDAIHKAPVGFALHEAHPNPFNPLTAIRFGLPETGQVNLKVYNIRGRLVATLVNGWRDAGYHEVTFDGSTLASGVYIYRMKAGDFTASGKMVLVK